MSDQNPNKNAWADKLQHLEVPDVDDSWVSMESVLNKAMPVVPNDDRRKWWLLLFLLLLVGVCNCPGVWRLNKAGLQRKSAGTSESNDNPTKNKPSPISDSTKIKPAYNHPTTRQHISLPGSQPDTGKVVAGTIDSIFNTVKKNSVKKGHRLHSDTGYLYNGNKQGKTDFGTTGLDASINRRITGKKKNISGTEVNLLRGKKPGPVVKKNITESREASQAEILQGPTKEVNDTSKLTVINTLPDTTVLHSDKTLIDTTAELLPAVQQKDSSASTANKVSLNKRNRGFTAGIGLNQFFPIGQQQHSNYNSGGTSGVLSDYIPVPQLRYFLNKKLYVQAEVQFNTPQYTKQLLIKRVLSDSIPSGQRLQHSIFIKKLFYFNVPISVHYSPLKNFYLGAGLQFARLNNAVALLEDKQVAPNRPDSIMSAKVQEIKTDSAYQLLKTNEMRFLFDASYHWKGFILGLRYNQALDHFISVPVSNTVITQARNNSLQLYLRYTLWDGRK